MIYRRRFFFALFSLGLFLAALVVFVPRALLSRNNNTAPPHTYAVTLGEDGFIPATVVVTAGDTVTFTTSRGKQFWPASNLHPTHTIYPEFDPKEPIVPDASWSFTFTKAGKWEYHDHLAPLYRGVVEVREGGQGDVSAESACVKGTEENAQCWEKQIDAALENGGVSAAFEVVSALSSNPVFQSDCHSYVHRIGEAAYRLYAAKKDLHLSPKAAYCGYGFYHGFMETLLHTTGDIQQARAFCSYVDVSLKNQSSDAGGACYHGIGHGAVDGSDPRAWGDVHKIMAPSLALCKTVADERNLTVGSPFWRCITGIYNAIEILSADSRYRIGFLRDDPFSFCAKEPDGYREPCYTNMIPAILSKGGGDFTAMAKRVEKIQEPKDGFVIRGMVMSALFHEFTHGVLSGALRIEDGVRVCRALADRSRLACIDGLSGGHMKYGEPTKEYIKAFEFCRMSMLAADERDVCFKHVLTRLPVWYAPQEVQRVCILADEVYQHYCR